MGRMNVLGLIVCGLLFVEHEIDTGVTQPPTVLTGFFRGGETAEIAVLHIDDEGQRRLQMYGFESARWAPVLDATLDRRVQFVDVANVGDRERLITYNEGQVSWFDPDAGAERPLLRVPARYNARAPEELARLEISRDLTGNGRDDLVIPQVDGFWIVTQRPDGSFNDPVKLGPPEPFRNAKAFGDKQTYGEAGLTSQTNPWYQGRLHSADFDGDGRNDLVFWNADHFEVHVQTSAGRFDPVPQLHESSVTLDGDGLYTIPFDFSGESAFTTLTGLRRKTRQTVLHSMRDLDGDGVVDLVTVTLEGRSALRQRGSMQVYFGRRTANGTAFAPEPSTSIKPEKKGTAIGYSGLSIFDAGDGRTVAMLNHVSTGLSQIYRVLVANSMRVNLGLYRMAERRFNVEPDYALEVKPSYHTFGRRGPFFPTTLVGDVTGDGYADLLVGGGRKRLLVYPGVAGQELFAREPEALAVEMPDNELHVRLIALTRGRGKGVLIQHRGKAAPLRLTVITGGENRSE